MAFLAGPLDGGKGPLGTLGDADGPELEIPAGDTVVDASHAAAAALLAASVGAQLGVVQVHFGPLQVLILVILRDGVLAVDEHVAQDVGDDAELVLIFDLFGRELLERVILGPVEQQLPLLDDPSGGGLCGDADRAAAVGVQGPGAVGGLAPVMHGEKRPVGETLASLVPGYN